MINNSIYQEIFDELSKYLPSEWSKLIVYLEYGNASYSFSFYVNENGKYTKCYDLSNISEKEISVSFDKINTIVSNERQKIKDKLWTNMTMVVSKEGKMHTDFDYTNLSEGTYQFKKNWKKKYLI